ncbi:MAG TPA: HAMP domain-containing sensor histidine kinase [Myxococcales bacterium]|nr:HAMP domain-containing sensor histidine kinase [Myxococcales bacterium]
MADRIAIIDDTEGTRFALRRTLEASGFDVVEGACGEDALRLAREQPDLIVLDVHLPDLPGPEVARRIKADPQTRGIPVLHLSASYTEESDRAFGLESGADAYLTEPVDPALLLATIHALLRAHAAERVAERALRARDEFLSLVSHDMRGQLQTVRLGMEAQLLRAQSRTVDSQVLVGAMRKSVEDLRHMTRLVEDLLEGAQLEAGKLNVRPERADLAAVIREAVRRWEPEARSAGSSIAVDAPEAVEGSFDAVRIGQIVGNLISNAIKYGNGKPISVTVRKAGGAAEIRVTDGGRGIEPGEQERIFERFERVGTHRNGSYGLGLWIARELARLHGGSIALHSVPGEGATFTVTLPLERAPANQ